MSLAERIVTPLGWALRGVRPDPRRSIALAPQLQTDWALVVTSSSFRNGERIPRVHCGIPRGRNLSPELAWAEQPADTRSLLLIIEDVDVPMRSPLLHTIALLDPTLEGVLPEGALTPGNLAVDYVPAAFGRVGYQGPRPLPGHGTHHYGFHLYALDEMPDAHALPTPRALLERVAGHVLAAGVIVGIQAS